MSIKPPPLLTKLSRQCNPLSFGFNNFTMNSRRGGLPAKGPLYLTSLVLRALTPNLPYSDQREGGSRPSYFAQAFKPTRCHDPPSTTTKILFLNHYRCRSGYRKLTTVSQKSKNYFNQFNHHRADRFFLLQQLPPTVLLL